MNFLKFDSLHILISIIFVIIITLFLGRIIYYNFFIKNGKNSFGFEINIISLILKSLSLILAIIFLNISLFGPVLNNFFKEKSYIESSNYIFLLDTSLSMNAQDMSINGQKVSREDFAKKTITNFVSSNPGNSYSLIIFSGESLLISPLTNDTNSFLTFLDGINTSIIKNSGTDINKALELASIQNVENKNIVIFSDGEDLQDGFDLNKVKKLFSKNKIKIDTIGVGTSKGDYIPTGVDFFGNISYKNYNGERVVTRLREDFLKDLSNNFGGEYLYATSDKILDNLPTPLFASKKAEVNSSNGDSGVIFVAISFLFLIIFYFIPNKLGKK